MTSVQKAIFPGLVLGCLFLVLFASLVSNPTHVRAEAEPTVAPTALVGAPVDAGSPVLDASLMASAPPANPPAQDGACRVSASYPASVQQWCGWIMQYAAQNGLDPNLVAAVMLQESGGNPQAYSKSGAVGLLQVMPRDGLAASFNCINGPCFASRPSMNELFDPEFNIAYGAEMLAGLIQYHGSIRDGLRAYGPYDMGYRYADIVLSIFQRYQ